MPLSYTELMKLVEQGVIIAEPELVNGASIDVRLDQHVLIEREYVYSYPVVDLSAKESPDMIGFDIPESGLLLSPGQCMLAATMEVFNLPNDIVCEFKLKSSIARCFLNCMLATWCDPCWYNSRLTLELKNDCQYHTLLLRAGMKIGQMIFDRVEPVPEQHSYAVKGRYNNTMKVTVSKGV